MSKPKCSMRGRAVQFEGALPKWNGARVSHPQQPELPMSARNSTGFGVVERAAARQPRSAVSKLICATHPKVAPVDGGAELIFDLLSLGII
jgi:hypothetical protein